IQACVTIARMKFPAYAEIEGQLGRDAKRILNVRLEMLGAAIIVGHNDGNLRAGRHSQEEVGPRRAREISGEVVIAVIVTGGEAKVGLGAKPAQIEAGLDGVAAANPGEVIDQLRIPRGALSRPALGEGGQ